MKTKVTGLVILLAVIAVAVVYASVGRSAVEITEINGYVGGEKIGLLEDEDVQEILHDRYGLVLDYAKAGSIDMITADFEGRNFLFPSNQTALELYRQINGNPLKSEIVLNTPIVLYTHSAVAEALTGAGMASVKDGVYYVDMVKLTEALEKGTKWSDIGMNQLYGSITVGTTDPTKSNSGNMFAGLIADTLCGGVADESNIDEVIPRIQAIFQRLGYMESSSSDLFDQFLKTGMGAKPLIAGYENQLLEFAAENPDTWDEIKGDIVMMVFGAQSNTLITLIYVMLSALPCGVFYVYFPSPPLKSHRLWRRAAALPHVPARRSAASTMPQPPQAPGQTHRRTAAHWATASRKPAGHR